MENIKVDNKSVYSDIFMARGVINGDIKNNSYEYSLTSPIYKSTNETISHKEYIDTIKEKERVLSIIGSGDQIINSILYGSKDIVGLDISLFPKYFLSLKLAAIKSLDKNDYLEYFYGFYNEPFMVKYYFSVRDKLDDNSRMFWDNLYREYRAHDIYNSNLFNDFKISRNRAIINNPFLDDNNYRIVKEKLDTINVELLNYNIFDVKKLDKGDFDLIILSNMINHVFKLYGESVTPKEYDKRFIESIKKYKKFLHKLPLKKEGQAITYNLAFYPKVRSLFLENDYQLYTVNEGIKTYNVESEILVYTKK